MDLKLFNKAVKYKAKHAKKRLKGTAKTYVSLFIVLILLVVGTTAWLTTKDRINVTTPTMELKSSNGIHDDSMQTKHTELVIPEFRLEEASSVDGRNIFFPTSTTDNVNDATAATIVNRTFNSSPDILLNWESTNSNMKTQTEAMRFREGNAGDKNVRYAYVDTTINAAGGTTNVWLRGYSIKLGSNEYKEEIQLTYNSSGKPIGQVFPTPYSCPIRVAIIDDSGHTPKVFDPAAHIDEYVNNTYAVKYINSDGKPTTQITDLKAFSSYYYGTDNPLFVIEPGHSINMTVVAWLEGSHPYARNFMGQTMTLTLEVETNVTQMEEIYLHDWTVGDNNTNKITQSNYISQANGNGGLWLASNSVDVAMSYYDEFAETWKTTVMTECTGSNTTAEERAAQGLDSSGKDAQGRTVYRAAIPKYVTTKISFYRLSKIMLDSTHYEDVYPGTIFNAWHTYSGVNGHLSSKATTWKNNLATLKENRTITGSTTNYQHYYAVRGNGHGNVAHNASGRYEKWLAPGIGYWGTKTAPVFS